MTQAEVALSYANRGIKVFPCCTKNKTPLTHKGFLDATDDMSVVQSWWNKHPNALIGSPNDQFVVLDLDDYSLDSTCKLLFDVIVDQLYSSSVLTESTMRVSTLSGGRHFYFKQNSEMRRSIKSIAQMDVLANGGYVVLPDQKNYVCETSETPWDAICDDLSDFDLEAFKDVAYTSRQTSKAISIVVKETKKASIGNEKNQTNGFNSDHREYDKVAEELRRDGITGQTMGIIDYQSGTIEFDIPATVYQRTNVEYDKIDPEYPLLEDGPLTISAGEMTSKRLMTIFHNRDVQERMASFIGIETPSKENPSVLMKSILPGHDDSHASMGVRWSNDGSHLVIRDFANFFGDKENQIDYNVTRMYMVTQYNTNVPRMNTPEWVTWTMRLMVEAGVLKITHLMQDFMKSTHKLTTGQQKTAKAFQLLDAIKRMYNGYDGFTVFADKFSAAWCGISPTSINRNKKALVAHGFLSMDGMYDCSAGKRDDGFFKTKLYSLISPTRHEELLKTQDEEITTNEESMKINEAVEIIQTPKSNEKSNDMDERYPDMGTMVNLVVDEKHQTKIKNFLEDYGLVEGLPETSDIMIPVLVSDTYETVEISQEKTYFMDKFVLDTLEATDGGTLLVAYGISPPISKLIEELSEDYESLIEDGESLGIVICNDIGDYEPDLDSMTLDFNEYMGGRISFSQVDLRYIHTDDIVNVMDGRRPDEDT
jgi:hypothetical protein